MNVYVYTERGYEDFCDFVRQKNKAKQSHSPLAPSTAVGLKKQSQFSTLRIVSSEESAV